MGKKAGEKKEAKKATATDGKKLKKAASGEKAAPVLTDLPKVIKGTIHDNQLQGEFRTFKSGSKGWWLGGKIFVDGVKCQVSCSVTVIGTKPEAE